MPVPAKPSAPEIGRVEPSGMLVRRDAFAAAVPPVSGWNIRWRTAADNTVSPPRPAGAYQERVGISVAALIATLSDLRPDYLYDVSIRAVNPDGGSTWSDTTQARTQMEDPMANLIVDLTEVQAGIEATAGTLVPATRKIPFITAAYTPEVVREELVERGTVRAPTVDVVTGRGARLVMEEHLSVETLLLPLLTAFANVAPVALAGAQRWTFTPSVVAPTALSTATFEVGATDGAAANYRGRFGFARPTSISITADGSSTAKLSTTWMGRAEQDLAAPAAVDAPDRWFVPARLLSLAVDDSWATRGNTVLGKVRSMTLTPDPGIEAMAALQGRADLDATHWLRDRLAGSLAIVVEHDGSSGAELGHWKAGGPALHAARGHQRHGGGRAAPAEVGRRGPLHRVSRRHRGRRRPARAEPHRRTAGRRRQELHVRRRGQRAVGVVGAGRGLSFGA